MMTYTVFTLCSNNYLAQAMVLGRSLLLSNPTWNYVVGLVDKKVNSIDYSSMGFEVVEVDKIGISDFVDMQKRYGVIELNTAVKPFYFQYLFGKKQDDDVVIYLDPDIYVYGKFADLEEMMPAHDIVLIPHCQSAMPLDGCIPTEEDILNTGIYNLGFLAVKKTRNGQDMIQWWAERLRTKAYVDFAKGLFTDQIWQNLVPLYYPHTYILRHKGYDVAYWNLHERHIVKKDTEWFVCDGEKVFPLVFFHFSGFNPLYSEVLSKYQNRINLTEENLLSALFTDYAKLLLQEGYAEYRKCICYYHLQSRDFEKSVRKTQLSRLNLFQRYGRVFLLHLRNWINSKLASMEVLMHQE